MRTSSKNRKIKRLSLSLFLLLFVLSVADYCLTVHIIDSGKGIEINPFMDFILRHTGFWTGLLIKQSLILPVGIVIYVSQRFDRVLWPCVALYSGIVTWNIIGVLS